MDHMLRTNSEVLPESAMVPERNLLRPPPNQFTHKVKVEQPYYFQTPHLGAPAEGIFAAGTKVVLLLHDGGPVCFVADDRGLYVATAFAGLRTKTG